MSDGGTTETTGGQPDVGIQAIGQYIKDLSFENPGAPFNLQDRPQIELGVDLQAKRLDPQHFEVELKLRVSAKAEDKTVFIIELVYGGMFMVHGEPPEDFLQQVLLIDAPSLMFPFARRVIADVVRDGGMPPLMIEPINFAALYRSRAAEGQARATQTAQV
ncbi:MAG TPA: protein-export chaperone SecB [Rhizomicrobium sp.]|jgi:preprotein translocase subunit SecB